MVEKLISALSSLTGIRESKLKKLETDVLYDIIDKPNIIDPTNKQLEKLNLLSELMVNLGITRDFKYKNQINFDNSIQAGKYFKHLIGSKKDKEIFLLAMFDNNENLIKIKKISEGTINAAIVYPRDVIKEALSTKCKSVMFCHNHPSGDPNPSNEDIRLTNNYINILEPLKIKVKDHIIVGDSAFSFLENGLLDYDETYGIKVSEDENIGSSSNGYYRNHLDKYLEALMSLTGISKERIDQYIEKEVEETDDFSIYNHIALEIIENPQKSKSRLKLNNSEVEKLKELNHLLDNMKDLKRESTVSINSPYGMYCYYLNYVKEDKGLDDNLYIMLFDSKLRAIGFEKLTYREGNNIVYNPKDILLKSLAYEATAVSFIMKSKPLDRYSIDKRMDMLENISQNTINILSQLKISFLDVLHIFNDEYKSLKEEGYLPYTNFGQPDYRKTKILDIKDIELADEEQEDEWDLEM